MTLSGDSQNASQELVLASLGSGVRGEVKRIDTHASIVFLEPDRVLKIKRAVRLPFLDFSTLEKRKLACKEEIAVNKRHAPNIYRRVVPITQSADGPEIDGRGPVIEWAVEMARFDEERTFDHLAAHGELTSELGEALAEVMLASHKTASVSDGSSWLASIYGIVNRNTTKFRTLASLGHDAVERLHSESCSEMEARFPLMQQRAATGLVRRCHGDAHLGNIVLIDGRPVLFDAIEFDPAIATTDLLYDLAFPIMDLIQFGERLAANRLFNCYLHATWRENTEAVRLLPLFMSMRAAIRAHVLFTKCEQSTDEANIAAQARSYFDLALRLIAPGRPSLVAIGGRSGTGKSTLARNVAAQLKPEPGAVVLRSDSIRKEIFGVDPLTALPETAYAPDVTAQVYKVMTERGSKILKQGLSVILDAAFLREAERSTLPSVVDGSAATFHSIFLDADLAVRVQRIASRGADASDATREVAALQETFDLGRLDWPIVNASGSPQDTLARVMMHLRN
jgi:aminoglycoside phosphotransferase family enzyme/predicted kinase